MEFQQQYILLKRFLGVDIQIRYYGIIIVVAMLVAAWMAARLAKQRGYDPDHVWGGLTWAIFPGIIGARLWFVLFPPLTSVEAGRDTAWYLANFFNTTNGAIAIWTGGLSIFGAVIGGLIGVWLYCGSLHNTVGLIFYVIFYPLILVFGFIEWAFTWVYKRVTGQTTERFKLPRYESNFPATGMPILPWLDIAAVVLPLAQAIGRWANFVNQELYGTATTLPWGIVIPLDKRVFPFTSPVDYPADTTLFHPLFLYESLWSLVAFFVLLYVYNRYRNRFKIGDFFLMYLIQYSFIRFLLEFLRVEIAVIPGTTINSSQAITGIVFVVALLVFVARRMSGAGKPYDQAVDMPPASKPQPASAGA
jgi:phosphatidylglycerol:prolipoprotein diacylglycerol transferase